MHLASGSAAAAGAATTAVAAAVTAAIPAAAGSTLRFTGRTAFRATVGLILEAFAREELLFARAKDELAVAINAVQGFICVQLLGVFLWRLILSNPLEDKMSALRVLTTFYAMFRAGRRDTMSTRPASRTITHSDESWRHFPENFLYSGEVKRAVGSLGRAKSPRPRARRHRERSPLFDRIRWRGLARGDALWRSRGGALHLREP